MLDIISYGLTEGWLTAYWLPKAVHHQLLQADQQDHELKRLEQRFSVAANQSLSGNGSRYHPRSSPFCLCRVI
jgi:hypothetical protein